MDLRTPLAHCRKKKPLQLAAGDRISFQKENGQILNVSFWLLSPFRIFVDAQLRQDTSALKFYVPKELADPVPSKTLARQPSGASR